MEPRDALQAGVKVLDRVLLPHGFVFGVEQLGNGSGGAFASGEYRCGDRRIELHFRRSLGSVTYHVGDASISHEDYMKALGVTSPHYPGFSKDPMDGFRHVARDLVDHGDDFLTGSAHVLRKAATETANQRAVAWREEQAKGAGDDRKREEARRLFRNGEYGRVVAILDSLRFPEYLTASERAALSLARRRASTGTTRPPRA